MTRTIESCFISATCLLFLLAPLGCGPEEGAADEDALEEAALEVVTVPAKGTASTFDVGTWNIEWFGSTGNGPTDEALQRSNARDVIAGTDLDVWGVQEIVSATQWNQLVAGLPGYASLLASDVTGGSTYYTSGEQKVGVLYKTSVATVQSAQLICTANAYDFGGRPPLEVKLKVTIGGSTFDVYFITLHAKALGDTASYDRRVNASIALKSYLDANRATDRVIVAGDFNDDVDTSMISGKASPYANFVNDSADYRFVTKALSDAGVRSTLSGTQMIDHQLMTNELFSLYVAGSVEVYRVDQYVTSYSSTTSDHLPVLSRITPGAGKAQVIVNEICANEPGSSTSGEFVEIVNVGGAAADLGGWSIADGTQARHTFPAGTSLAAGGALVVFGGSSGIPAGLGNAVAASTGGLGLGNSGDTVALVNASGATVDTFTFGSSLASTDGVSMNRSPDASAQGTFVLHTALTAASASPGKRANGSAF
ncbi:lamin tail domain-containing protein [Polyangium aurulentum]|uniref:lamin tail domain-containing protein n=1 Tax=Polyangium aurulentum TaxID=2567896 RepID=UPI001F3F4DDD|nr:lamin tail domain-containing protein [Polyangium aurulentum]